jgi:PEP-CTERM motif
MAFGAATILVAASLPALAGNLVTNGGFEDNFGAGQFNQSLPGSSGGQSANHPGTTARDWTVVGTDSSFADGYAFVFDDANSFTTSNGHVGPASGSANPSGFNTLPLWGNSSDASPDGNYFYGVDSTYHPSALTQEIGGLIDGHTYTLTFDYAAAQQFDYDGNTIDDWDVTLGGQTIATTNIDLHSHAFSGWETESVTFTYEGDGGLLSFVNNGMGGCNSDFKDCAPLDPSASGGPPFSLLDGVSLTGSAPEPSTWAMMFIGFAGLAYAGVRNRRRSAISVA